MSVAFGCPHGGGLGGGKELTAEQYLALQYQRSVPEGMRATGVVGLRLPQNGIRLRTSMTLLVVQPNSVRGEVQGFGGRPAMVLAMNDERLAAWLSPLNSFVSADDPQQMVDELTGGLLDRQALLEVLVGRLPTFAGWTGTAQREPDNNQIRLDLDHANGARVLVWLHDQTYEPQRLVGRLPGIDGVAFALGFEDFEQVGAYRVPRWVTIEVPPIELKVELDYSKIEVGVEVTDSDFRLEQPEGSRVRSFDEMTGLHGGSTDIPPTLGATPAISSPNP